MKFLIPAIALLGVASALPQLEARAATSTAVTTKTVTSTKTTTTTKTATTTSTKTATTTATTTSTKTATTTKTASTTKTATITKTATSATTVTATVTANGTTSATTAASTCLSTSDASDLVSGFGGLLTAYSDSAADALLADDFSEYSQSINWLGGTGLDDTTFPSKAAFKTSQESQYPLYAFNLADIDVIGCNTLSYRWSAVLFPGADAIAGLSVMYVEDGSSSSNSTSKRSTSFQIKKQYVEINSGLWSVQTGGTCAASTTTTSCNSTTTTAASSATSAASNGTAKFRF